MSESSLAAEKDAEIASLRAQLESWKAQAGRDQSENRVLRARLAGAHPSPGERPVDDYPVPQLVQFLNEAASKAKEGRWGMWRSKEFEQAARALDRMHESYLAECPHEVGEREADERAEKAEAALAESRTVTDAQRTKMLAALEACVRHHADAPCSAACAASVWDEWRAAIMCMPVEQPAAESRTLTDAQRKLDEIRAEHYQDADGRGCAICGAQDGYRWPCTTRLILDEQPAAEGARS